MARELPPSQPPSRAIDLTQGPLHRPMDLPDWIPPVPKPLVLASLLATGKALFKWVKAFFSLDEYVSHSWGAETHVNFFLLPNQPLLRTPTALCRQMCVYLCVRQAPLAHVIYPAVKHLLCKALIKASAGGESIKHSLRQQLKKTWSQGHSAQWFAVIYGICGSKLIYWCGCEKRHANKMAGRNYYESACLAVCNHKY